MAKELSRDEFLQEDELKKKKVEFEDGNYVYVREMTGAERDALEQSILDVRTSGGRTTYSQNLKNYRAKLATYTLCDKNGNRLLKLKDYKKLGQMKSAAKLDKIADAAQELSGISQEDRENLVKNSKNDQTESSNSDSAEN